MISRSLDGAQFYNVFLFAHTRCFLKIDCENGLNRNAEYIFDQNGQTDRQKDKWTDGQVAQFHQFFSKVAAFGHKKERKQVEVS